jgi:plasmid replication initiation protein
MCITFTIKTLQQDIPSMTKPTKKLKKEDPRNELIVQHNHLIEARYHLTLQEKRLMCWLASQVKQTDEDFKEHELSIKEFAELIDVKGDHLYKTLDTITHKLMQKIITIRSLKKKGFAKAALLGGVEYYEGQGIIKLSFHPYLKPYMLQLKDRFTQISLGDVMGLKSVHAMRIYEVLKQYESIGNREISLSDLRDYCGIEEGQYKNFNDLKRFLLQISQKEINNKTDLFIGYEEIKTSRKVTSIKFTIKPNSIYKSPEFQKNNSTEKEYRSASTLIESFLEYGFSKGMAKRILKGHEEDVIKNALKSVNLQIERNHVKNAKAMLQTAIKEKWHPEVFKKRKRSI